MLLQLLLAGAGGTAVITPPPDGPRILGQLGLAFVDENGTVTQKLRVRQGEIKPVRVKFTENGNPIDLASADPSTLKITIGKRNQAPIINGELLSIVTPSINGIAKFTLTAQETSVTGKYFTEAIGFFFTNNDHLKFPGPHSFLVFIIDHSLITP